MSDTLKDLIEENKKLKLHIEFLNKKICLCDTRRFTLEMLEL